MNLPKPLYFLVAIFLASSCSERFPVGKRYWDPEDYRKVIFEIEFNTPEGEEYPRFSNPETAMVIRKLVDPENYKVILDDPELGLNFKGDVSEEFFDHYRNLNEVYRKMDRQDKYVYAEELIEIEKFGLGLQIQYFKLGNERIRQESDSPESSGTRDVLRRNEQRVIDNFNLYLEHIDDEGYFSSSAALLADGITTHFFKLIETFPEADYAPIARKATALIEKTQVPELKTALNSLLARIASAKKPA